MTKNPRKITLLGARATSVLSVALVLLIVGLCATLGIAVQKASKAVGEDTTILVTMAPGEDVIGVSAMKREFNAAPWVSSYEFTSADRVLSREVDSMDPMVREGLALLSDNPFGDEFVIHISDAWRNSDSLSMLVDRLQVMPGVDIVSGDATAMARANDGLRRLMLYLSVLALVLLIISVVLINNTISLSIYSRRFNIHTMKLVGATNSFIRRPFVRAGMITGVVAGLFAAVAVCGVQIYLMINDELVGPWITVPEILVTAVVLILLGALIARAAAWRAATVYLNKSYDLLFKN